MADTPESMHELLAGYALGDLSPEEAEALRQALAEQPELATELQKLQEVLAAMPYALPEVPVPEDLRSKVLNSAQVSAKRPRSRQRSLPIALSSVAAIAALAFGLDSWRLREQLATTQAQIASQKDLIAMLQQPTTELVTLKSTDEMAANATGNVVVTPGDQGVIVALQNLPPLQTGQYYYLWVEENGKKVACGKFTSTGTGNVFVKLVLPTVATSKNLVVTVENSPTMSAPQGPMIMTSTL